MRFSAAPRLDYLQPKSPSNQAFFETVAQDVRKRDGEGVGIVLVGGSDAVSLVLRHAQGQALRFDQLPSYWSHCALIAEWDEKQPGKSLAYEVTLFPRRRREHAPERNGVTTCELGQFYDDAEYPNVAFIQFPLPRASEGNPPAATVLRTALQHPNRERTRYTFWHWLAPWGSYVYAPAQAQNPIAAGVPWPSAALCEYAYEAAGLDITPGATNPNACPEIIWSTALYWHDRYSRDPKDTYVASVVRDKAGTRETV